MDRATQVLEATAKVGFDPTAPAVAKYATAPPGGLYVNWIGTWDGRSAAGANTNLDSAGQSDTQASVAQRHDPLTDLVVLRDFFQWSQLHPGDHRFDALEARLRPIVRAEFTGYATYRGWIYGQLIDLDRLDPGHGWSTLAEQFVARIAATDLSPGTGALVDPRHDSYRVDWAADFAGALADAGRRFHRSAWVAAASVEASYLLAQVEDRSTGLFPLEMARHPTGPDTVVDPKVKVGAEAQLLDGLLSVYGVTRDHRILDAVNRAVTALWSRALGVHDAVHKGFFFEVNAGGTGAQTTYKESRQAWVLPLLQHLSAEGVKETAKLAEMRHVVTDLLWQPSMDGYPYQVTPSFTPYVHHGVTENWVTSEAMGIAANALLGLSAKNFENS